MVVQKNTAIYSKRRPSYPLEARKQRNMKDDLRTNGVHFSLHILFSIHWPLNFCALTLTHLFDHRHFFSDNIRRSLYSRR